MQKIKKYRLLICCTLAVVLLISIALQNLVGTVSAKYVKDIVFNNTITVPKNYYTVTYYQYDGTVLENVNEYSNMAHSLRDGTGAMLPSGAESFIGWVNALGNSPDLSKREDYGLYPAFKYPETTYEVRFMDMKGEELLGSATFKESQAGQRATDVITDTPTAPTLTDLEFTGWGVRTDSGTVSWSDYTLTKADVVVYAQYTYNGNLQLTPVDEDGDGTTDYYRVDATANLEAEVIIPGYINGIPVAVITDLASGFAGNVETIIVEDGVETINKDAFAFTPNLKNVTIPLSVTSIGANTFSSGWGILTQKQVTITYDGTWEQWDQITENGWDDGLVAGSKVVCADGTYVKSGNIFTGYEWSKQ